MFTYLLAHDQGKYYVGRTTDIDARFKQHWTKKGALWTKRYKPHKIMLISRGDTEKQLTLRAMRIFGVDRVRGGPYVSLKMKRPKELRSNDENNEYLVKDKQNQFDNLMWNKEEGTYCIYIYAQIIN